MPHVDSALLRALRLLMGQCGDDHFSYLNSEATAKLFLERFDGRQLGERLALEALCEIILGPDISPRLVERATDFFEEILREPRDEGDVRMVQEMLAAKLSVLDIHIAMARRTAPTR